MRLLNAPRAHFLFVAAAAVHSNVLTLLSHTHLQREHCTAIKHFALLYIINSLAPDQTERRRECEPHYCCTYNTRAPSPGNNNNNNSVHLQKCISASRSDTARGGGVCCDANPIHVISKCTRSLSAFCNKAEATPSRQQREHSDGFFAV
jgi:hypothetical protein